LTSPQRAPGQQGQHPTASTAWSCSVIPTSGAIARPSRDPHELRFAVHVRNDNRERTPPLVQLKALCGPGDEGEPVILMPDED
jgi:hypothetical protein